MGVLIEGMEMPKRGMVVNIHADGRVTRHFDEFGKTIGKAVSVPPHGRLIDADALVKEVEDIAKELPSDSVGAERFKLFAEFITEMPTIIPAEPPKEET